MTMTRLIGWLVQLLVAYHVHIAAIVDGNIISFKRPLGSSKDALTRYKISFNPDMIKINPTIKTTLAIA